MNTTTKAIGVSSVATAAVGVFATVTRWQVDNATLLNTVLLVNVAAHAAQPLAEALYARVLAWVQPKAVVPVALPNPPVANSPIPTVA